MPGKRPHGNRIRAWGLSASRSAPILHRISSLDGVQATGEYTSAHSGLYIQQKQTGETIRRTISLRGSEEGKCGNKASFATRFSLSLSFFFLKKRQTPRSFFFFFFCNKKTWEKRQQSTAVMDIMIAVQDACVSGQWLTAIILSLCCFLPSCLPAGQTVDYSSVESVVSRQGDTALLR